MQSSRLVRVVVLLCVVLLWPWSLASLSNAQTTTFLGADEDHPVTDVYFVKNDMSVAVDEATSVGELRHMADHDGNIIHPRFMQKGVENNIIDPAALHTPSMLPMPVATEVNVSSTEYGIPEEDIFAKIDDKLVDRIRASVAFIHTAKNEFNWLKPYKIKEEIAAAGSGWFVDLNQFLDEGDQKTDGLYVMTNAHVVQEAVNIYVQLPNYGREPLEASVISSCPQRDLALLNIQLPNKDIEEEVRKLLNPSRFLPLGNSDEVTQGEEVMAVGYPLGQSNLKFSRGIVSGREHLRDKMFLQITAPINHGNSGGPLIDGKGHVVGINTAGIERASNVGYAIPINQVTPVLRSVAKSLFSHNYTISPAHIRTLRFPPLGFEYNIGTPLLNEYMLFNESTGGVYVKYVAPKGLFVDAGVKEGDVVFEFNGHPIDRFGEARIDFPERVTIADLANRINLGDEMTVKVWRHNQILNLSTIYEWRPSHSYKIEEVYEPLRENVTYEIFGGMVFMDLTMNMVDIFAEELPSYLNYYSEDSRLHGKVVVTHVFQGTDAAKANVRKGMSVRFVNGKKVQSLDDFRAAFAPESNDLKKYWVIELGGGDLLVFNFKNNLKKEVTLSKYFGYEKTYCVKKELEDLLKRREDTPAN